ncbi:MAG: kelch repeat-containing protein, partial [Betaproteobacteria bacterium]
GNATYSAASPVSQSFPVGPAAQNITFNALNAKTFGVAPFAVSATASSGLAVVFASGTPSVCTVSGTTVTILAGGGCTITATQPGNANYSAASPVSQPFIVNPAAQSITFGALTAKAIGSPPFALSASASSGLTVAFASGTLPVCTVSGSTVTIVAAGTCTINATQAGNPTYSAAPPVSQSFAVTAATQTITFAALGAKTFGNPPFAVTATASSGLTVAFASGTPLVCTVTGTTVTIIAGGSCTITATQPGDASYGAAPPVSQGFTVNPATQTVTFPPISPQPTFVAGGTGTFLVSATGTASGISVVFTSNTQSVCTTGDTNGSTVTMKSAGNCIIVATQAANASYLKGEAQQIVTIKKAAQAIDFPSIGDKSLGLAPFTISATAKSGTVATQLLVSFATANTAICTVSVGTLAPSGTTSATLTLNSTGTCTITASRADDGPTGNYNAATPVAQSFQINTANVWTPTAGKMTVPRSHHTATRFETGPMAGKVLITGGLDANGKALDTTELYDPVTRKFTASGKLDGKSVDHTATLLQDGRVVVIGGGNDKVDVFTPATQKWTSFGAPPSNRTFHSATLLPDGRVLIVGGVNGPDKSYNTTLIFNPANGKFTNGPTMDTGRERHTATLLTSGPNFGKVLIVGGRNATGKGPTVTLATWQLCTATACTPSQGGISARVKHDAVAFTTPSGAAKILIAGGTDGTSNLASAEIYDVATGTWSNTGLGVLTPARKALQLTELPNGRVLAAGGRGKTSPSATGAPLAAADIYPPFAPSVPMSTGRSWHTATALRDAAGNVTGVLVTGGKSGSSASSDEDDSGNPSVDTAEVFGSP